MVVMLRRAVETFHHNFLSVWHKDPHRVAGIVDEHSISVKLLGNLVDKAGQRLEFGIDDKLIFHSERVLLF